MQFNSYIFIMVFLPFFVVGYLFLNRLHRTAGKVFLILMSLAFYLYGGLFMTGILLASCVINFLLVQVMRRTEACRKPVFVLLLLANVGLLFYFKYYNFFIQSVNALLHGTFRTRELLLPLGISFFTFQQIMYGAAILRGEIKTCSLLDYLAFILYFPKLIMGPMMEPAAFYAELYREDQQRIDWRRIESGLVIFGLGLFKKLVLADTFAAAVAWGFANEASATGGDLWIVMLSYTFQIYFDFSGYSDMAVGISEMVGIRLPMNFNSPYKALSIRDFWKRWHMTLTGFLTKNIYIPLGGNRKGTLRMYLNTLVVFLISGIWHGANWTFILWGLLHGILSIVDRLMEKCSKYILKPVRFAVTFLEVSVLWLLFRAESIPQWVHMLREIFSFRSLSLSEGLLQSFVLPETSLMFRLIFGRIPGSRFMLGSLLLFLLGTFGVCLVPENNYRMLKRNSGIILTAAAMAFAWAFLCLSNESVFVYFNF